MLCTTLGCCSLSPRGGVLLNDTLLADKVFSLFGLRPWLKPSAALLLYIHGSVRAIGGDARKAARAPCREQLDQRGRFAEAWDTCQECKLLLHAINVAAI